MGDVSIFRLWLMRAGFVALIMAITFLHLLPLDTLPSTWVPPDLVMGFSIAWAMRRPEYVPAAILAPLFLLVDLMLGRPPGLYAALLLIVTENMRGRSATLRNQPFGIGWLTAGLGMIFVVLTYRAVLALTLTPEPSFGLALLQLGLSVLTYPLVVLVTRYGFGLRPAELGEVNAMGQRV